MDIASEIHKVSMFIILDLQITSFTRSVVTLTFCVCTKLHLPNQRHKLIMAIRTNSVDIFLLDAMLLLHTLDMCA